MIFQVYPNTFLSVSRSRKNEHVRMSHLTLLTINGQREKDLQEQGNMQRRKHATKQMKVNLIKGRKRPARTRKQPKPAKIEFSSSDDDSEAAILDSWHQTEVGGSPRLKLLPHRMHVSFRNDSWGAIETSVRNETKKNTGSVSLLFRPRARGPDGPWG